MGPISVNCKWVAPVPWRDSYSRDVPLAPIAKEASQ
jgi:hypothetical protein